MITALDRDHLRHAAHHLHTARACLAVLSVHGKAEMGLACAVQNFEPPTGEAIEALATACLEVAEKESPCQSPSRSSH